MDVYLTSLFILNIERNWFSLRDYDIIFLNDKIYASYKPVNPI